MQIISGGQIWHRFDFQVEVQKSVNNSNILHNCNKEIACKIYEALRHIRLYLILTPLVFHTKLLG